MLPDLQRTIVALASATRGAPRAIVRLAGPDTLKIVSGLCSNESSVCLLPPEIVSASRLAWCDTRASLPAWQRTIPLTLLYWPDDRSYTGSPAAELHLIGSLPLAQAVIDRCCQLGAQVAQRGEFTLRAFLAGKLDLAQAEAVLGVIQADTTDTLAGALAQLGGNLAPAIAPLREVVIGVLAELEAGLDFVDEDIQFIDPDELLAQLRSVADQIQHFAQRLNTRSTTDLAAKVILAGLPNSGKSTLFNALAQQHLAIVADVSGTTRDYLQHRIVVEGIAFDIVDTAGWESLSDSSPRALAQEQLASCLKHADVVMLCLDLSSNTQWQPVCEYLQTAANVQSWLVVGTKCDLETSVGIEQLEMASDRMNCHKRIKISQRDSKSIDRLRRLIADEVQAVRRPDGVDPLALVHETAIRCRSALIAAQAALDAAMELAQAGGGEELIAAELRLVIDDLSTIIGQVHSDDVLGEIFSRFCIGK